MMFKVDLFALVELRELSTVRLPCNWFSVPHPFTNLLYKIITANDDDLVYAAVADNMLRCFKTDLWL